MLSINSIQYFQLKGEKNHNILKINILLVIIFLFIFIIFLLNKGEITFSNGFPKTKPQIKMNNLSDGSVL